MTIGYWYLSELREKFTEGDNTNIFCNAECQAARYARVKELSDNMTAWVPSQLQSIDKIMTEAQQLRTSGFLPGLPEMSQTIGDDAMVGSLKFTAAAAKRDIMALTKELAVSQNPSSSVAVRSAAKDVFISMSELFDSGRTQLSNVRIFDGNDPPVSVRIIEKCGQLSSVVLAHHAASKIGPSGLVSAFELPIAPIEVPHDGLQAEAGYAEKFNSIGKTLGDKTTGQLYLVNSKANTITNLAGAPLEKVAGVAEHIKGIADSVISEAMKKANQTSSRSQAMQAFVEDIITNYLPRLEQESKLELDKALAEANSRGGIDIGPQEAALDTETHQMMMDLARRTGMDKQDLDAKSMLIFRAFATAMIASDFALRKESRRLEDSARKAFTGFERDLLKQRKAVRQGLLKAVKSTRDAEKDLEWMARNAPDQLAANNARVDATRTAFQRLSGAIETEAVGGFSKKLSLLLSQGSGREDRVRALVGLLEKSFQTTEKEKSVKLNALRNITEASYSKNERHAGGVNASSDRVLNDARNLAAKMAIEALQKLHTEEQIVQESEARTRYSLNRTEEMVTSGAADIMGKVAEFNRTALPELVRQLALMADNTNHLISILERQMQKSYGDEIHDAAADGRRIEAAMKESTRADRRLRGIRQDQNQAKTAAREWRDGADKSIDLLRDDTDKALKLLGVEMKAAVHGVASSLDSDVSQIVPDGERLVKEKVANSTASLNMYSDDILMLLGSVAKGLAFVAEEVKKGHHLLLQQSANLTTKRSNVKRRLSNLLAAEQAASTDVGIDPRAIVGGAQKEMEQLLLAVAKGLDSWLSSEDDASKREVSRLGTEVNEMAQYEGAASRQVESVEELLTKQRYSWDTTPLKLLAGKALDPTASHDIAAVLSTREMEEERNLAGFKQYIEQQIQHVKGPSSDDLRDFAKGLLRRLEAAMRAVKSAVASQIQQMKSSDVSDIHESKAKLVELQGDEVHRIEAVESKSNRDSAWLKNVLQRMKGTLGILKSSGEAFGTRGDTEATRLSEQMAAYATTAGDKASQSEQEIGRIRREFQDHLNKSKLLLQSEIENSSVTPNVTRLQEYLANAEQHALELLKQRSTELNTEQFRIERYQSNISRAAAMTHGLEQRVAGALANFEARMRSNETSDNSTMKAVDDLKAFVMKEMERLGDVTVHLSDQDSITEELSYIQRHISDLGKEMPAKYKRDLTSGNFTTLDSIPGVLRKMSAEQADMKAAFSAQETASTRKDDESSKMVEDLHHEMSTTEKELLDQYQESSKGFNSWLVEQKTRLLNSILDMSHASS